MEDFSKQPRDGKSPVQWHTLSENLMDLDAENGKLTEKASDTPLSQGYVPPQYERTTADPPAPPEQWGPDEAEPVRPGKKKKPIWGIAAAVIALMIAGSALICYFTVHRWTEPTCTEASVCTICGKTGSPATGHQWTPATCTSAKKCSVCHETEGTPLGHDLMDETSYDYIECTKESWKACSRCEYRTSSQSAQLTSLLYDTGGYFRMSPNATKGRVEHLASQFDPKETLFGDRKDNPFHNMKNVTFRWGEYDSGEVQDASTSEWPILECYADSELVLVIAFYNLTEKGEVIVQRDSPSSFDSLAMILGSNSKTAKAVYQSMEIILVAACDPEIPVYSTRAMYLAIDTVHGAFQEYNGLLYGISDDDYSIGTLKMAENVSK